MEGEADAESIVAPFMREAVGAHPKTLARYSEYARLSPSAYPSSYNCLDILGHELSAEFGLSDMTSNIVPLSETKHQVDPMFNQGYGPATSAGYPGINPLIGTLSPQEAQQWQNLQFGKKKSMALAQRGAFNLGVNIPNTWKFGSWS